MLKRDPGQILIALDTPEADAIKAANELDEPLLNFKRDSYPRYALGLINDACTVAKHDEVGCASRARHLQRMKQRQPFGVAARSLA